jgi:hypothetical protein
MARKRKKVTHRRRSRRSMGAIGTGQMGSVISMIAGAVVGKVIANKVPSTVNPKIVAAGTVVAGFMLPKFVKNKFVAGMGSGMIVVGALNGLTSFGVISAISGVGDGIEVDYMGNYDGEDMSGTDQLQSIAGSYDYDEMGLIDEGTMSGSADLSILSGYDNDEESDY